MTRRTWLKRTAVAAVCPIGASLLAARSAAARQSDDRSQWNRIYAATDFPYKTEHNEFLAEMIKGRTRGTALDIGMGRGRNSLYLASQGWTVTGVDIADEGLRIAAEEAKRAGLKIDAVLQDFAAFDVGTARWDLIAGLYMGDLMIAHARRIITGLKPGGLLVVENFARDVNQPARVGGAPLGYSVNQLLSVYADLRIRRYEDTRAVADWAIQSRQTAVPVVRLAAEKQ